MEQAYDQLTQACHKLAEAIYQRGRRPGRSRRARPRLRRAPPPTGEADDGVIDAEYVDVEGEEGRK